MNNLQAMIDGMGAQWQRERAASQMTLGEMIKVLEAMPEGAEIEGIGDLDSYRGYYSDLAFAPVSDKAAATKVLALCRAAMGKVFEGYKGGDYVMGALTPLWIANYGDCGNKIISINEDGSIEVSRDENS